MADGYTQQVAKSLAESKLQAPSGARAQPPIYLPQTQRGPSINAGVTIDKRKSMQDKFTEAMTLQTGLEALGPMREQVVRREDSQAKLQEVKKNFPSLVITNPYNRGPEHEDFKLLDMASPEYTPEEMRQRKEARQIKEKKLAATMTGPRTAKQRAAAGEIPPSTAAHESYLNNENTRLRNELMQWELNHPDIPGSDSNDKATRQRYLTQWNKIYGDMNSKYNNFAGMQRDKEIAYTQELASQANSFVGGIKHVLVATKDKQTFQLSGAAYEPVSKIAAAQAINQGWDVIHGHIADGKPEELAGIRRNLEEVYTRTHYIIDQLLQNGMKFNKDTEKWEIVEGSEYANLTDFAKATVHTGYDPQMKQKLAEIDYMLDSHNIEPIKDSKGKVVITKLERQVAWFEKVGQFIPPPSKLVSGMREFESYWKIPATQIPMKHWFTSAPDYPWFWIDLPAYKAALKKKLEMEYEAETF